MFAKHYAKYYDLFNSDKPYKKEISFVYKWADQPGSILDIGCGTADYWKYFPDNVNIIGIERSRDMVDISSYKGKIECLDMCEYDEFVCEDIDCVTALFDVINYMPDHNWWQKLHIKKGGYFIFDIWDKKKALTEGFRQTIRSKDGIFRVIDPVSVGEKEVKLRVEITCGDNSYDELHTLYLYSEADLKRFAGEAFKIVDRKEGKGWQTWYKLQKI